MANNEIPEERKALNYRVYQSNIAVCKEGNNPGNLKVPRGLIVDVTNQNIIIADSSNSRVQIFNQNGEPISIIGQCFLKCPWGVAVNRTHLYVTDVQLHTVFMFRKSDLTLISATGKLGDLEEEFNFPSQPGLSHKGYLYIPDRYNNRIQVIGPEFQFLRAIRNEVFIEPVDIKVTLSAMYILCHPDKPSIQIMKQSEDTIRTIRLSEIHTSYFFCIDPYRNFVISDFGHGVIKIMRESEIIFRLAEGKVGDNGEGILVCPCGLGFSGGKIVSVSHNNKFGLQVFSPPPYPRFIPD